jgi:hypothetical protein
MRGFERWRIFAKVAKVQGISEVLPPKKREIKEKLCSTPSI